MPDMNQQQSGAQQPPQYTPPQPASQPIQTPPQQSPLKENPVMQPSTIPVPASSGPPRFVKPLIAVFVVLLLLGGGAYAAYYFDLIPFGKDSKLSKQMALQSALGSLKDITSAEYNAEIAIATEPRSPETTEFDLSVPQYLQEEQKRLDRDADVIRKLQTLFDRIHDATVAKNGVLPDPDDISAYIAQSPISYTNNESTFTVTIELETMEAREAIKRRFKENEVQESGNKLLITRSSADKLYFYFYPQAERPAWVSVFESREEYLEFLPSDFSASVRIGGSSRLEEDSKADARFSLAGDVNAGDFIIAVDVEAMKIDETFYGRVNKFPAFFFDLSRIKGQWVRATQDDILAQGYSSLSFLNRTAKSGEEKSKDLIEQYAHMMRIAMEEELLDINFDVPNEGTEDAPIYVYEININEDKVVSFYERVTNEFKETYGDDAVIKFEPKTLRLLQSPEFKEYIQFMNQNSDLYIKVDANTGLAHFFSYSFRLASPKHDDEQMRLTLSLALSSINENVELSEPANYITLEDAQIEISGQSREVYRFNQQASKVATVRGALASYRTRAGVYPASLELLTMPRNEVVRDPNASGAVFEGFAEDDDAPFIAVVPTDVFTKRPYTYRPTENGSSYELTYTMELPPVSDESSRSSGFSFLGSGAVSVNELVRFIQGANTATPKYISQEAEEALARDSDGDGLPDRVEDYYGSSNSSTDSDGDGFNDYAEVQDGYDPAGSGELDYYERWRKSSVTFNPIEFNYSSAERANIASAKGHMTGLLSGVVLCQDSGDTIQSAEGSACDGVTTPKINEPICSGGQVGIWPDLSSQGFLYDTCSADTDSETFSYGASNGICEITCSEEGCTFDGC